MQLIAIDIGGTHARFALAETEGTAITLGDPVTLKTSDYTSLPEAWAAFCASVDYVVPSAAAIAIAGPVTGERVKMTNNTWVIDTGAIDEQLRLERASVINDFAAVAHAVAQADASEFKHIFGRDVPLPQHGTISVVGPGTGLGVAQVHRIAGGYHAVATEGGHVGFAPQDALDDAILARLRKEFARVSVERVVSGPGIVPIYLSICAEKGQQPTLGDDRAIWEAALANGSKLAEAALERFCFSLGSAAGDYALAHGANAVVLAGGLGYRLRALLPASGFARGFTGKGRYEKMLSALPVKLITLPEPGLYGAAAAFLQQYGDA